MTPADAATRSPTYTWVSHAWSQKAILTITCHWGCLFVHNTSEAQMIAMTINTHENHTWITVPLHRDVTSQQVVLPHRDLVMQIFNFFVHNNTSEAQVIAMAINTHENHTWITAPPHRDVTSQKVVLPHRDLIMQSKVWLFCWMPRQWYKLTIYQSQGITAMVWSNN